MFALLTGDQQPSQGTGRGGTHPWTTSRAPHRSASSRRSLQRSNQVSVRKECYCHVPTHRYKHIHVHVDYPAYSQLFFSTRHIQTITLFDTPNTLLFLFPQRRLSETKKQGVHSQSAEQLLAKLHAEVQDQSERKRSLDSQIEDRIRYLEKLQGFENDRSTTEVLFCGCVLLGTEYVLWRVKREWSTVVVIIVFSALLAGRRAWQAPAVARNWRRR